MLNKHIYLLSQTQIKRNGKQLDQEHYYKQEQDKLLFLLIRYLLNMYCLQEEMRLEKHLI